MEEMWRHGRPLTVRAVLDALNRRSKIRAYTTILTTMVRLRSKGLLTSERRGHADVYAAALTRDAYRDERARAQVDALVAAYGELALIQLAREIAHHGGLAPGAAGGDAAAPIASR